MSYPPQAPGPYGQPPQSGFGGPPRPGFGGHPQSGPPYPTSPAGQFHGGPTPPGGGGLASKPLHIAALAAAGVAFLLFALSLFVSWVVQRTESVTVTAGITHTLKEGDTLNQLPAIMYFLFTFTAVGVCVAAPFVPEALRKPFAYGAAGAAALDLLAILFLGYRIMEFVDQATTGETEASFGNGWFVALGVTLVLFLAAGVLLAAEFTQNGAAGGPGVPASPQGGQAPYRPQAAPGYGPPRPGPGQPAPGYGPPAPGSGQPGPGYGQPGPGFGQPGPPGSPAGPPMGPPGSPASPPGQPQW